MPVPEYHLLPEPLLFLPPTRRAAAAAPFPTRARPFVSGSELRPPVLPPPRCHPINHPIISSAGQSFQKTRQTFHRLVPLVPYQPPNHVRQRHPIVGLLHDFPRPGISMPIHVFDLVIEINRICVYARLPTPVKVDQRRVKNPIIVFQSDSCPQWVITACQHNPRLLRQTHHHVGTADITMNILTCVERCDCSDQVKQMP